MQNVVAKFCKVSQEQWNKDCKDNPDKFYDSTKLPCRATVGSAGYDFYAPFDIEIGAGKSVVIPTGIRCKIDEGYVLMIFPRSGLGFRHGIRLMNTVGIIDSDYFFANNEGHIMCKLSNPDDKVVSIKQGDGFAQGILLPYFLADEDEVKEVRTGGFGSTDK